MADMRTGLTAALVALGGAGGLAYTARTFRLGQVGQLTGRFASASKQMGNDDQTVRLAGIHAMAQLADEWVEQRQTCIDVLCAFLRVVSDPARPQSADLREAYRTTLRIIKAHLGPEQRQVSWQQYDFDFTGAVLKELDFTGVNFAGGRFLFEKVKFEEDVRFDKATFAGAYVSFRDAELSKSSSRVSFADALFRRGNIVFDGMRFGGGEARFDGAEFEPDCLVTFNDAQLGAGGSIYFKDVTVQGSGLRFTQANFASDNAEVRFDGAKFSGTMHFNEATFDGHVHFDKALFGRDAHSVGTRRPAKTNLIFAGAKLNGGEISFEGADCTDVIMHLEDASRVMGNIDFSRRAKGDPQIIPEDPTRTWVLK